ncbi:MAG: ectoine hydroxylase-related dioxygenase (phytanoyl-CoA dioxygenase family) [Verrucomicrobiales bacterium]|jgi:ectoine hydroxylase-related dioxygenase (phytanoyl-CoA dioxygenase family)
MQVTGEQQRRFDKDGFVFVDDVLDVATVTALRRRYGPLFDGEFDTGVTPDEVNWRSSTGDPTLTRQICNGWKGDRTIAWTVLDAGIGKALATLARWSGVRLIQDNVLWKPPGARSLGYHRDNAYCSWFSPSEMITCWIALDDTTAEMGSMEFAVGSHRWPNEDDPETEFHAPDDYRAPVNLAASRTHTEPLHAYVELAAGSASFHHGWMWHGSGPNTSEAHRRALVIHCSPAVSKFAPERLHEGNGPLYGHYRTPGSAEFPEEHFPILWHESGYRSPDIGA